MNLPSHGAKKTAKYREAFIAFIWSDMDSWMMYTFDVYVYLGGGFKYFLFSPLPGEMIQFD